MAPSWSASAAAGWGYRLQITVQVADPLLQRAAAGPDQAEFTAAAAAHHSLRSGLGRADGGDALQAFVHLTRAVGFGIELAQPVQRHGDQRWRILLGERLLQPRLPSVSRLWRVSTAVSGHSRVSRRLLISCIAMALS